MDGVLERSGDIAALMVFLVAWAAYEPLLRMLAGGRHIINTDMILIRRRWMGEMVGPTRQRLLDSQLMGHALNSASFFASSNLILIAGSAGLLFGGDGAYRVIESAPLLAHSTPVLFSIKLGLIALTLARGFLSFIWAIRQLNYCVAVIGAAPLEAPESVRLAYAEAASAVLTPALSTFNAGVRAYYFALAATAWLFGPAPFAVVTLGAVALLGWRQAASPAARAIHRVRDILEAQGPGARPPPQT